MDGTKIKVVCRIEGCKVTVMARGYCPRHYWRLRYAGELKALPRPATFEGRFWAKVNKDGAEGCWLWTGALTKDGYGRLRKDARNHLAHRVAYEMLVGPVPDGMELDHVLARGCRFRHCVNPAHLEPVAHAENVRRGRGPVANRGNRCRRGHLYDEANTLITTGGDRFCRACARLRHQAHAMLKVPKGPATHCKRGHPFDEANTLVIASGPRKGKRQCRECHQRESRDSYHRRKPAANVAS